MTRRWILMLCVLLVVLPGRAYMQDDPAAATLIDDFDGYADITEAWWSYSDPAAEFVFGLDAENPYNGAASLLFDVNIPAGGYAGIGFDYGVPMDWTAGTGIVFQLRADTPDLPLELVLHLDDPTQTSPDSPGKTPFGAPVVTTGAEWSTVTVTWDAFERLTWMGTEGLMEFTPNPITSVEIAFQAPADAAITGTIWVDDMRVISDTDLNALTTAPTLPTAAPLRASQIGYRPDDPKYFVSAVPFSTFDIVDTTSGTTVFTGSATNWGTDADAGHEVTIGQFDDLTTPGTYKIVVAEVGESYPFVISEDAFADPLYLATRAFYLSRSGIAIHDVAESGFDFEAGHPGPAVLWDDPNAPPLDIYGGWYDAGDFGRYIPTAAFASNQLMYAFAANPTFFDDGALNIPESANGLPDLLDEIRWELDWMLRMQDADGAVHNKITTRDFPGLGTLPAEDTEQLYVFGISSADTAYFAAAMAQAAGVFADYDPDYAAICQAAALQAWAWLEQHPEQVPPGGFQNPPVSEYPMQGGYDFVGTESVPRLWAAAELLKLTGDPKFETAFAELYRVSPPAYPMSWANAYPMALFAYLNAAAATNADLRAEVTAAIEQQAQTILEVIAASGYQVALNSITPGFEYVWGSNQVALSHGLFLMLAQAVLPDADFREAALAQIQYILGVNPIAKAYISGIGSDPVQHPHHNVSFHFQTALPGLIGEGANNQASGGDAALEAVWASGAAPAQSYVDDWESWASNEPTIDANATFVALASYFAQ